MPWQRHVIDVALEIDPDTGRLAYNEVGLTVPRQSGKSTLILAKAVHRASATQFFGPRQRIVYTAQTRNKAREKWEEDYAADLKHSKTWRNKVQTHFGNGNEHIRFANGSRFGIEANTEKAGHGSTLDEAYIDEAFAQADGRLEQAFRPAMITRPNTQLCWVSTAGWLDGSPYLNEKVQRGRDQAQMGVRAGLAYFEWSAPEDADVEDRDMWWETMPALGHTITEADIAAELVAMSGNINDFRRAYMNQWVLKDDPGTPDFDVDAWWLLEDMEDERPSPIALSVEVSNDRAWTSIGLAGRRSDGLPHVEIVQAGRGTGWVVDRLVQLQADWRPTTTLVNMNGPAGSLVPALEAAKVKIRRASGSDFARSCALFADAFEEGRLRHAGQRQVAKALGAARKKWSTDRTTYQLMPADDTVDISPLRAVTLALLGLEQSPKKKRAGGRKAVVL